MFPLRLSQDKRTCIHFDTYDCDTNDIEIHPEQNPGPWVLLVIDSKGHNAPAQTTTSIYSLIQGMPVKRSDMMNCTSSQELEISNLARTCLMPARKPSHSENLRVDMG